MLLVRSPRLLESFFDPFLPLLPIGLSFCRREPALARLVYRRHRWRFRSGRKYAQPVEDGQR